MVARSRHHSCIHKCFGCRVEKPLPLSEVITVVNVITRVDDEVAVIHLIGCFNYLRERLILLLRLRLRITDMNK